MDCSKNRFFRTGNDYILYFRQGHLLPSIINDGVLKKPAFPTSAFEVITVFMLNYKKMSKYSIMRRTEISPREEINEKKNFKHTKCK